MQLFAAQQRSFLRYTVVLFLRHNNGVFYCTTVHFHLLSGVEIKQEDTPTPPADCWRGKLVPPKLSARNQLSSETQSLSHRSYYSNPTLPKLSGKFPKFTAGRRAQPRSSSLEDTKLKKEDKKLQKEDTKLQEEDTKLQKEDTKLQKEDTKLQKEDKKLQKEDTKLQK